MPVSLRRMAFSFATVCALALGLAAPASASTVRVSVNGSLWDVSTKVGSENSLASTLMSRVWWQDRDLAILFASAVGLQLGTPNFEVSGPHNPYFNPVPARY